MFSLSNEMEGGIKMYAKQKYPNYHKFTCFPVFGRIFCYLASVIKGDRRQSPAHVPYQSIGWRGSTGRQRYFATSECLNDVCISPPSSPCFYLNRQPVQSVIARLRSICKISGLSHLAWIDSKACLSVSIWILMVRMLRLTLDWMLCCCRRVVSLWLWTRRIRELEI